MKGSYFTYYSMKIKKKKSTVYFLLTLTTKGWMSLNKCFSPKRHKPVSAHRKGHIQFSESLLQMTSRARATSDLSELLRGIPRGDGHLSEAPAILFPLRPSRLQLWLYQALMVSESPGMFVKSRFLGPQIHTTVEYTCLVKVLLNSHLDWKNWFLFWDSAQVHLDKLLPLQLLPEGLASSYLISLNPEHQISHL